MVLGIVVGAAIFVQPAEINRHVPNVAGVFLVWAAAGFLSLAGALVCAEVSAAFPRTGGVFVFLKETLSPGFGFLRGWAMFWSVHSGIIAAAAVIFARYLGYFLRLDDLGIRLAAIAGIAVLSAVNYAGAMLFSNVNGVALAEQRFWPVYEAADELGAVLYIHPTSPVGVEAMTDSWLMPLLGFPFDTTLAAAKLVFSGVAERLPRIRWVLAHLGGTIPYVAERLDRGFMAFRECRVSIARPPSAYFRRFYYDTVNFDARALELAIGFAGIGQLLAISDYPHQIGSILRMLESIRG